MKNFTSIVKPTPENIVFLFDGNTTQSKILEALTIAIARANVTTARPYYTLASATERIFFFKPMSNYFIQATEKWFSTNPGRQVASLSAEACQAQLWPVDKNVFPEHLVKAAENINVSLSNKLK